MVVYFKLKSIYRIMLSQKDFEELIDDPNKYIEGDIIWNSKKSAFFEFLADIVSDKHYPLRIKGYYNSNIHSLSYVIIHISCRQRIYALDLGRGHKNPDRTEVGKKHKHRWNTGCFNGKFIGDAKAYVPDDITALANDPVGVWKQFCLESKIIHKGNMQLPQLPLISDIL